MIARRPDWHARLLAAYETGRSVPFMYGVHDCCLWAAHCVDLMCDTRIAREIAERFNYRDEATANAVIASGGGLFKLVSEFLGQAQRPSLAHPGDVLLVRDEMNEDRVLVGVLFDHHVVAPGERGMVMLPLDWAICCWKV